MTFSYCCESLFLKVFYFTILSEDRNVGQVLQCSIKYFGDDSLKLTIKIEGGTRSWTIHACFSALGCTKCVSFLLLSE